MLIELQSSGAINSCDAQEIIQSGVKPVPFVSGVPLRAHPSVLSTIELSWSIAL